MIEKSSDNSTWGKAWSRNSNRINGQQAHETCSILLIIREMQIKTTMRYSPQLSSVSQSCPTLQPHELQHARPPCPSPTPRACSNSCPLSQWCHPTISSSVVPFSSSQSFPASGSFQMSQLFASGGQSIGASASASVLLINIQDWFPWGLTDLISL